MSMNNGPEEVVTTTPSAFVPKQPYDPDTRPVMCEVCGKVQMLKQCHSLAMVYRMPGLRKDAEGNETYGYAGYQCADNQHFACSHEHALLAVFMCTLEHIHTDGYNNQQHAGELELQHPTLQEIKQALDSYIQKTLLERDLANNPTVDGSTTTP